MFRFSLQLLFGTFFTSINTVRFLTAVSTIFSEVSTFKNHKKKFRGSRFGMPTCRRDGTDTRTPHGGSYTTNNTTFRWKATTTSWYYERRKTLYSTRDRTTKCQPWSRPVTFAERRAHVMCQDRVSWVTFVMFTHIPPCQCKLDYDHILQKYFSLHPII